MTKQKDQIKKYNIIIAVLSVAVVVLGGLFVYASTKTKTRTEEQYLAVYDYLMHVYPGMVCDQPGWKTEDKAAGKNYVCTEKSYGISKDGDPYVSFIQEEYDGATHEKTGNDNNLTIYFERGDEKSTFGFGEALGYDD